MVIGTVTLNAAQLDGLTLWLKGLIDLLRGALTVICDYYHRPDEMTEAQLCQIYRAMHDSHLSWCLGGPVRVLIQCITRNINMDTKYLPVPLLKNGHLAGPREAASLDIVRVWKGVERSMFKKREECKWRLRDMFGVRHPKGEHLEHDFQEKRYLSRAIWSKMPLEDEKELFYRVIALATSRYRQALKVLYRFKTRDVEFYTVTETGEFVLF